MLFDGKMDYNEDHNIKESKSDTKIKYLFSLLCVTHMAYLNIYIYMT